MEWEKEPGKDGERLSPGEIKWGQERTQIMHEREQKSGREQKRSQIRLWEQYAWKRSSREKIREADMNGEWRWTGVVTRLSINSALSASASQSPDLEGKRPHRIQFIRLYCICCGIDMWRCATFWRLDVQVSIYLDLNCHVMIKP